MRVILQAVVVTVAITLTLSWFPGGAAASPIKKPRPTPSVSAQQAWVEGTNGRRKHSTKKATSHSDRTSGTDSDSKKAVAVNLPRCEDNNTAYQCRDYDPDSAMKKVKKKAPTQTQISQVAAKLKLPDPTPRFGPDPSVNEWNMLAVGFPIWLWTDRPTTISTNAHHDGLTFTLTATWTSTTFTMGDGHSKTCAATTIRPKTVRPDTKPSPTCGYVYQTKSKIGNPYTVVADTHWRIDWSTNGYSGTFDHTYTGSRTLEVGELQSLING